VLVSVATMESITAQAGMLLSPRKYPLSPVDFEPSRTPSAVQPTT